ncbi:MAG: PIN domain-containing protein [Candidatus Sulfotelmatobacter sp.]
MTAPVFVDTNVFIYYLDQTNPNKFHASRVWLAELWKSRRGRVSFQVLQELYSTGSRKWPLLVTEIKAEMRDLLDWDPVIMNAEILESSWKIQERYQLSFWDSLIVAAAKAASCAYLLTEDMQAGQDLDGVLVVNPFRRDPAEILST